MKPGFINLWNLLRPAEVLEIMSRVIQWGVVLVGGGGCPPGKEIILKWTETQEQTFAAGTEISMVS